MQKPNNYESTSTYGEFEPLEIGGHILKILQVEETKSKAGRDMLAISLDTDRSDSDPGYFMDRWKNDSRPKDKKKWGCIVYQLIEDSEGNCNRGLKTFLTSVEESNPGFTVQWGDNFCQSLRDKRVGGIFRREQYRANDGTLKWSTKCYTFRSVQTIIDGVEKPKDKYLEDAGYSSYTTPQPVAIQYDDFTDEDGQLPF